MSEHTIEPWFYTGSDIWNLVPDNNGEATQDLIANASENDARRIVACVNACAGIETETIESVDSEKINSLIEDSDLWRLRYERRV